MNIFQNKVVMNEHTSSQDIEQKIEALEALLADMRVVIGERRTMLSNTDKKLQQFQDSIYAVLMEEDHPSRRTRRFGHDDHGTPDRQAKPGKTPDRDG